MNEEEKIKIVRQVFDRLSQSEEETWTDIDTYLEMVQFLDDDQLMREAEVQFLAHKGQVLRCKIEHKHSECFAPKFPLAAGVIIDDYIKRGKLAKNARYIIEYYLTLSYLKVIFS